MPEDAFVSLWELLGAEHMRAQRIAENAKVHRWEASLFEEEPPPDAPEPIQEPAEELRSMPPDTLVTTIEQIGCYGPDEYGRLTQTETAALAALGALRDLIAHEKIRQAPGEDGQLDPWWQKFDDFEGVLKTHGWPSNQVPNFKKLLKQKMSFTPKERNGMLKIIGVLSTELGIRPGARSEWVKLQRLCDQAGHNFSDQYCRSLLNECAEKLKT